jgi:DNA repair protein RadD
MFELRPYQIEAVEAVYEHLRTRDDNPCVVLPTGCGKSICVAQIVSDAVQKWSGRVLILAHVKELLEQNADKIRVLCPELDVGVYSAGLNSRDTDHAVIVAGIQSVYTRACELGSFDLVIVDECFPAGTLISTPRGDVPIEDLYVGQPVHTALGVGEIECISARSARELITLELNNGKTITCTPNHPFFTANGWLPAEALAVGTCLYSREDLLAMRQRIQAADLSGRKGDSETLHSRTGLGQEKLLLASVCGQSQSNAQKQDNTNITDSEENQSANMEWRPGQAGSQDMPLLWYNDTSVDLEKKIRTNHVSEQKIMGKDEVLFNFLFKESREPDVSAGNPGEGKQKTQNNGTQTISKRGQWMPINRSTTNVVGQAGEGMGAGTCCADFRGSTHARSSQLLQVGLSKSPKENSDTIRWRKSSIQGNQKNRQTRDNMVGSIRVDRISHIKLSSQEVVYNLQVKGHPSYFANGALVHNCHLIAPDGEGMYRTFLADAKVVNPNLRIIGLTATPFRMKGGLICKPENLLNHVCYEAGLKEMIAQGYLSPLVSRAGRAAVSFDGLHVRGGEFISSEVESLMDNSQLVDAACREIVNLTQERNSVLIFTSSVEHCNHVAERIAAYSGTECGIVTGSTSPGLRAEIIARYKGEEVPADFFSNKAPLKYLANVNVLTTGFDATNVDCIVLLRPTNSAGLLVQMVGRGTRLHPGKENCLVLDYGGNIMRHGPVDMIQVKEPGAGNGEAPAKKCPECLALIHAAYMKCPECGYQFPPPEKGNITARAESSGVLSGQVSYFDYDVHGVEYSVHHKRGAPDDAPKTMRIEYCTGFNRNESEWVCPEHSGYARRKFEAWWKRRSNINPPTTAHEAVLLAGDGALAEPSKIIIKSVAGEKFPCIADYELGEPPAYCPEPGWNDLSEQERSSIFSCDDDDDIPF